ncbi:hypothetical protein [Marinoscillum furvescens]|uniref:Outer membrane protein with beta-barrel domain n=1 Tax=Marinoscillum furvescens DSM 4134 TaxID=1122208 RepID=A0A3D9KVY8_MARFU|nr:hypothetical protein [Marinoscillum furvescens]RED91908.1 hypothetical protein C7460_13525 [Marinoscillum furvescens DSM 4134]
MQHKILATLALFTFAVATAFANGSDDKDKEQTVVYTKHQPQLAINSSTYHTAVGVRGLGTSGLTIKHFTGSNKAIEGIIGLWPDAFSATLLFEKYVNAFDEPGLNWYYGVGGHIATQSDWVYYDGVRRYERDDDDFGIGVDGIFGIEYKIHEAPIAVSLDVKPFLEVTTNGAAYLAIDPGLGVKFTF